MSLKILVATGNLGKFKEFAHFFSGLPVELKSLKDFPAFQVVDEPYQSFEENAVHKARSALLQTGLVSLADDSGLEVDALGGAPGVFSARYAGPDADDAKNNAKLLKALEKVAPENRTARFKCVLALALTEHDVRLVEGTAEGVVLLEPRGEKGFGYDPLFLDRGLGKTFAELDPEEKLRVSHRGAALRKMKAVLEGLTAQPGRDRP
jgi:XTP/dITP diphosphohydrolase